MSQWNNRLPLEGIQAWKQTPCGSGCLSRPFGVNRSHVRGTHRRLGARGVHRAGRILLVRDPGHERLLCYVPDRPAAKNSIGELEMPTDSAAAGWPLLLPVPSQLQSGIRERWAVCPVHQTFSKHLLCTRSRYPVSHT